MSHFLRAASCWAILMVVLLPAAEPPQTGPLTEKRFPPLRVPPGFQATLFACDPLIEYPAAIALGPRASTLFVAVDYMTGLGTEIIRRDEIRLVEDTDGDGYADRAPVWADGFNSIQGLTFHDGSVFVMHSPFLTALRDTTGSSVVIGGFSPVATDGTLDTAYCQEAFQLRHPTARHYGISKFQWTHPQAISISIAASASPMARQGPKS